MVDVCLPGTGGMLPLPNRWLTCCFVEHQGKAVLIDCGEGTQIALKAAGCKLSRIGILLITHYHADHIAGLPGLLLTLGNCGKTSPLKIIGPPGLHIAISALTVITPALPYPLQLYELEDHGHQNLQIDDVHISCLPLAHSIPCIGYRIAFRRMPIFSPQKAADLGVPKALFHTLHSGQPITLQDGRSILPEMVLDGMRAPIQLCYCTDTRPMDELTSFAKDVDLLISEGMYGDEEMQSKMAEKGHMLFSDSAKLARDACAKQLWLTHFSPALCNPSEFLPTAQSIFPAAAVAYDGIRTTLGLK